MIGSMAANVSAYVYHLVVGRILGPAQYGELSALLSLSYILNVFALAVQTVVTKFVAHHNAKHEYSHIRSLVVSLFIWFTLAGAVAVFILLGAAAPIATYLHVKDTIVIYVIVIGVVVSMLTTVLSSVLQGLQYFIAGMIIANVISLFRLGSGVVAAGYGVTATLIAGLVAAICSLIVAFLPVLPVLHKSTGSVRIDLKALFRASLTTVLAIASMSVMNSQDVVLVKHYFSADMSGLYAALSTMGKIIFFASSSFMYVLLPVVAERSSKGEKSQSVVYFSVLLVGILSSCISIGYWLFPSVFLGLLYGSSFVQASTYLGLFAIFSSLYTVSYTLVTALLGIGAFSVWGYLLVAACLQYAGIQYMHQSMYQVISVNIAVTALLVVTLLLYYRHAVKTH